MRVIWYQFVMDVMENPEGGGGVFQSQLNIDSLQQHCMHYGCILAGLS